MKTLIVHCASAIALSCVFAGPVSAASVVAGQNQQQLVVSYADLDLSNAAGAMMLLGRLESAARQVCGNAPDIRQIERQMQYRSCYETAMNNAVHEVPSSYVKSLYTGKPEMLASDR